MKQLNKILWGLVFVTVGVLLALNAFEIISFNLFFKGWWTLFMIVPGVIGFVTEKQKRGWLFVLAVGVILLLCSREILQYSLLWKLVLPTFIVILGLEMLFGGLRAKKERGAATVTALFSGCDEKYNGQPFNGKTFNAIFGGAVCDLRGAIIGNDCTVFANALFGGISIVVPNGVRAVIQSTALFGGVEDKTKKDEITVGPTLYIKAKCLFGGVTVKQF